MPLLKVAVAKPGVGLLQKTKSFRKELAQAYIEDAFLRPHMIHRCKAPQKKPPVQLPIPLPCKRTSGEEHRRALLQQFRSASHKQLVRAAQTALVSPL